MSRSKVEKKTDLVKVFLAILVVALAGISGLLYYQITQWEVAFERFQESYSKLQNDYVALQDTYSAVRSDYITLRDEYSKLQDLHSACEMEKRAIQNEYNEVLSYEKRIVLEEDKTLNLTARGDAKLWYDIPLAGYIEVNFSASSDIYLWVGSSLTQGVYYARYPPFPHTAMNGTVVIPVCDEVFLQVNNPNEFTNSTVTLTITYVY